MFSFFRWENQAIEIGAAADLLLFNGHNGLMDEEVDFLQSVDGKIRDVSVIGCISYDYFEEPLKMAKGYPLLMTTNLMAPEAYVMESVIETWANLEKEDDIHDNLITKPDYLLQR